MVNTLSQNCTVSGSIPRPLESQGIIEEKYFNIDSAAMQCALILVNWHLILMSFFGMKTWH